MPAAVRIVGEGADQRLTMGRLAIAVKDDKVHAEATR